MASPYLHNTVVNAPDDLVIKPLTFLTTAGTGVVASFSGMPGVTVARTAAGTYTVTDTEGYAQCVAVPSGFTQATIDAGAEVLASLPAPGATTYTIRTVNTASPTAAVDLTNATQISVLYCFRKNSVP